METSSGKRIVLTEKLELDIIELPKIIGKENVKDDLLDWLYFLENPKSERVEKNMEENEELKEAVEKLDILSEDERMQRIADLREKAILDEKACYDKGIDDGIVQGIEKGAKREKMEIAKKMLGLGVDIEIIIKSTDLTKEEIEKLK